MEAAFTAERACAVILAGGLGTRVRELYPDVPKPMIPVAGQPFLEWVIRYLAGQGLRHFVVSLGHLANVASAYLEARPPDGLSITTVTEPAPMGTGGGLMHARGATGDRDPVVVANGDSLVLADLSGAWRLLSRPSVDGVIVGVRVGDASRYGSLEVDGSDRLLSFREKRSGQGTVNAGLYLFRRHLLDLLPQGKPFSLEEAALPLMLNKAARILVHSCNAPFLDIGTPASLKQAEAFVRGHLLWGGVR